VAKKINSREKGKAGEREFAALCRKYGFENARRGQQIERDELGRFVRNENKYVFKGDIVECYHKGEKIFIISAEDYDLVKEQHWYLGQNGYIYSSGTQVLLHRYIMKPPSGYIVDHINRNKRDNRRENLRLANKSLNAFNSKIYKNNKSGVTGVYFRKNTKKWTAEIKVNYRKICLGCYETKEEAINARKKAEQKYINWEEVNNG